MKLYDFCQRFNIELTIINEDEDDRSTFIFVNHETGDCFTITRRLSLSSINEDDIIKIIKHVFNVIELGEIHFVRGRGNGKSLMQMMHTMSVLYGSDIKRNPKIKNVIFNKPATIVFWSDGTKTVVKTRRKEKFDKEKGLAMAVCKKFLGKNKSHSDYYDIFKKWGV